MKNPYSEALIKRAHKATIFHEREILNSAICTCFYCGHQFNPQHEEHLDWTDEEHPKGKTLLCPMCHVDCVIGNASGFPITKEDFIIACTEAWFGGYSRISDGLPIEKVELIEIEVD
ncbi:MAG: hypothetical protein WC233_09700 [Sphaerochaeta sp.]|jgi:hypothetical protein